MSRLSWSVPHGFTPFVCLCRAKSERRSLSPDHLHRQSKHGQSKASVEASLQETVGSAPSSRLGICEESGSAAPRHCPIRPFHIARPNVVLIPGSGNSRASLRPADFHPSKIRASSGLNPEFQDSSHAKWAYLVSLKHACSVQSPARSRADADRASSRDLRDFDHL